VLDTLKAQYKVTWVLLNESSVTSLDEGVLTLRFPRPGNVKGFAGSRHEEILKQVLQARFGVNVVVRAISGGDPSPGERRRPRPEPVPPVPPPPPAQPQATQPSRPATAEPPPAPPAPPAGETGSEGGTTRTFGDNDVPFPADDEFDPDDEDMAASSSAELTGMALVQRELGGQIIGEFED
jgi:DNA polymerase-3 subunit gamma/tau